MEMKIIRGTGLSSNIFILIANDKQKILVIDLGGVRLAKRFQLREVLKEILTGVDHTEVLIEIFLTHCHVDHILGEKNVKDFPRVTFSASPNAANHINARDKVTLLSMVPGGKISFTVEKTYEDGAIIPFPGAELKVIHAPGHTDGSAVIYDQTNKALFAGDVVFVGGVGRVDFPTGNQQTMIETLTKLSKLEIDHLYSGHGEDLHHNVQRNILAAKEMFTGYY